jgi:hypothetical protein
MIKIPDLLIREAIYPCSCSPADESFFGGHRMADDSRKVAKMLHDELSQHLVGTLLAAGALKTRLTRRQAPEASEAAYLLDMLKKANEEFETLVFHLDGEDNHGRTTT